MGHGLERGSLEVAKIMNAHYYGVHDFKENWNNI
jgi:hypothetical protein